MQLESFRISGLRCLADASEIPFSKPTILTGPNDGGKSTALQALAFLLGQGSFKTTDRTRARPGDINVPGGVDAESNRFNEISVIGRFRLEISVSGTWPQTRWTKDNQSLLFDSFERACGERRYRPRLDVSSGICDRSSSRPGRSNLSPTSFRHCLT